MSEEKTPLDDASMIETADAAKFVICPCCGKPTLAKPVTPNQALTDHWLACMVTATPFSHTYPVYGGRLNITVVGLSPSQAAIVDRASTVLDSMPSGSDAEPQQTRQLSRMYAMVSEITITAGKTSVFHPQAEMLAAAEKLCASPDDAVHDAAVQLHDVVTDPARVSAVPVTIIMTVLNTHARLDDILMATGFDENFWKGIELA